MESKQALAGLKVLDLSLAMTGPLATQYLGQYGAQVIKIESRKHLDMMRVVLPYKDDIPDPDRCAIFVPFNSNKLSITLDLTHPRAIEVVKKLVLWADVVVESFRPGVIESLGLGYEELAKIKPDIIMVSNSMYGRAGPRSKFTGFGPNAVAAGGLYYLTGWPDREPTQPISQGYTDLIAPLFIVVSIITALEYRLRTGKGQYIDCNHVETGVHFIAPAILDYTVNRRIETRQGNRSSYAAPHGVFRCKGDDSWCAIAVFTDQEWKDFCRTIGNPKWTKEAKFSTLQSRKENEDELERCVEEWTIKYSPQEVMKRMQSAGVPAGVVQDAQDVVDRDPQLKERGSYVLLQHSKMGPCYHASMPGKLSKTPLKLSPAPCLGQDNHYVYTHLLGMSDTEFVELLNEGVFQ